MKNKQLFYQNWSEVTNEERNETVFEHLNKAYGAYEIRTNYDRTLLKAFSATGSCIILLSAIVLGTHSLPPKEEKIPDIEAIFESMRKPDEPIIPEPPKQPVTHTSPKTNQDTEPMVKDNDTEDPIDIIPKDPDNNSSVTGNPLDTTGNTAFNSIGSGTDNNPIEENDSTYDGVFIQEPPTFPGGDKALFAFLQKNISYPESGGKGTVAIAFVLDQEGNVTEVAVLNASKYPELNKEAARVIKKLPKWNPGKQQGRAVKVRMILPIRFELKQ